MAAQAGSKSESESEDQVFENMASPLKDKAVTSLESKCRLRKRQVTTSVNAIQDAISVISKAAEMGSRIGNNIVVKGYVTNGAKLVEKATHELAKLENLASRLFCIYEQIEVKFPERFTAEIGVKLNRQEEDLQTYRERVTKTIEDSVSLFKDESIRSAQTSAGSSRSNSPPRKRFLNVKHMLPQKLATDCTLPEYHKFKRDFSAWIRASYPDGVETGELWNAFMSQADAGWQERAEATMGMRETGNTKDLFEHCDQILLILFPVHTRRIQYLGTKPDKGMKVSAYLQRLTDEARNADIASMTAASLTLHIFCSRIQDNSELNKLVKTSILEELRIQPNQSSTGLTTIMNRIKGHEADAYAGADKNQIRFTGDGDRKEIDCKVCKKSHLKSKCSVKCSICKMRGSHITINCWRNPDQGGKQVETKDSPKRDRSQVKENKRRQRKKDGTPKPSGSARRTREDSESDFTDRASEISSADDEDVGKATNKTRQIRSHRSRRLLTKTGEEATVNSERDSSTEGESASITAAPLLLSTRSKNTSYRGLITEAIKSGNLPEVEEADSPRKNACKAIRSGNSNRVSATMLGKIRGGNAKETFIADSGTTIPIVPKIIAAKNNIKVYPADPDEPGVVSASGHELTIIGQATIWIKFDIIRRHKKMRVLICEEEGDEILIDIQSLVEWSIIPPNFPMPMDPNERERVRVTKKVASPKLVETEESVDADNNAQMVKLRNTLMKEFADVFKKDLEKHDRIRMDPVIIETIEKQDHIRPSNAYTAIETPLHLQRAASAELARILKAGMIEECKTATSWCSRGFFVTKPSSDASDVKVRLVSDFRGVNKILRRPGHPMDGSSMILKRLNPSEGFFCTIDLSSGYHQIALAEESRDLFAIVLPQGKYRYTVLPQGAASSCDIFNLLTDSNIRNKVGYYKNIDDILTSAKDITQLEQRLRALLSTCREKNMKLNPSKFNVGHSVTFGGVELTGKIKPGDSERRVYITPAKKRLEEFFKLETPTCRADVQRIVGLANQLKRWTPGLAFQTCGLRKLSSKNTRFMWNPDLQLELETLKKKMEEHIVISPLDVKKEIHGHIDAAQKEGMAYLLCQPRSDDPKDGKVIVACNSTSFSETQKRYSPFECEALCAVWLIKSEDYYLRGADEIKIYTDAKGLKGLYEGELGKIANSRLQNMMEKLMGFNISFIHVPGKDNEIADYGSRYPRSSLLGEEFPILRPSICHRSRRVQEKQFDARDPEADRIAMLAADDADYQLMVTQIADRTPWEDIDPNSELRKIGGTIRELSIYRNEEGHDLILKDGREILIPASDRANMMEKLHSTHLETEGMKRLCRGKFWWPKHSQDLAELYRGCTKCKEDSNAKVHRPEVIPEDLTLLAPGEQVSMDFASYGSRKYLIIKDRTSGYLSVEMTKDQTTKEAIRATHLWVYTFGLPHKIRTDDGPAFRKGFQDYLTGLGIAHVNSSAYNPESNGLAERGVKQIKDVLKKIKKPTKEKLLEVVFDVNNHVQNDSGSASERFFKRGPRTKLPNSINRQLDHQDLIRARHQKQERIARKKGRTSRDSFRIGDRVVLQNPLSKRWTDPGEVTLQRTADDGTNQSFEITLDSGQVCLRNKRFMKFETVKSTRQVSFALTETSGRKRRPHTQPTQSV